MGLCKDCDKRASCTVLCPEALAYVMQDEVNLRELTVGLEPRQLQEETGVVEQELNLAIDIFEGWPREKQVLTLLNKGLSRSKIVQVLGITRGNLRLIIYRLNKKRYKDG